MNEPAQVDWLQREDEWLAPFAMRTRLSRGRKQPEEPHPFRAAYQRDRDRIVHSTAFRRLMYKTQVLVAQTNDHHRTRLTHTLEVAQISRTVARQLRLNEDLVEAIALAHDLGHPPFGHAGEGALDDCMRPFGGFEHNLHGLRILEYLEHRYAEFQGLNLSWEVLEAQAHHSKRRDAPEVQPYVQSGKPILEAQLVDAADSLTYDTHDIDDALGVGLITVEDLDAVPFWQQAAEKIKKHYPGILPEQFRAAVIRTLIDWQVRDLLDHTQKRLQQHRIETVADVRQASELVVGPGPDVQKLKAELEAFLHERVYRHYRVLRMATKGTHFIRALFAEFCKSPELLPERYRRRAQAQPLERTVCDYLAGMTDRFAQNEYQRLFQPYTDV